MILLQNNVILHDQSFEIGKNEKFEEGTEI